MTIDTNKIRNTYVAGKKAYFVSDIENQFGTTSVKKLVQNKTVFTERVKHNNNSQTRRLVFHKDFVRLTETLDKPNAAQGEVFQEYTPMPAVKGEKLEIPEVSLAAIRDKQIDLQEEREAMIKNRIKDLCYREARKNIKEQKLTDKEAMRDDRKVYREPYLILYSTFDRYMRAELIKFRMTLEDVGLGYAKNVANKPYLDRITEAGQLNNLLVVAEALFQSKPNN